jgi:hypothetical protein
MAETSPQGQFAPISKGTVRGWAALPRFRHRTPTGELEYFFAARFKNSPSIWILWNGEEWSLIKEELMLSEFQPSNEEARKLLIKYDLRDPSKTDLDAIKKSIEG